MEFHRVLSWVLAIALLAGLLPASAAGAVASESAVVLRFVVASDLHLTENPNDSHAQRVRGMFESASAYAQSQPYQSLDAVVLLGDIVCMGNPEEYASLKQVLDGSVPDGTDVLSLMGNHEWWLHTHNGLTDMGDNSYLNGIAGIDCISEKSTRWSTALNGYHFVGFSPISYDNYSLDDVDWAADEIADAVAADNTKPVFVFQHHPIKNTVLGSFGSAAAAESAQMDAVYANYHQIVHFSGHSHISINSPTAINQTTYTQYTTGTMANLSSDGTATYNGTIPGQENVAQYTIVEVTADNRVDLIPYDQFADRRFAALDGSGEEIAYSVDVNDPDNWLYNRETRADRGGAPAFSAGATATVSAVTHETFTLSFPQATDDHGMYGYDILCDDGTNQLSYRIYSEWYFQPMPAALTYEVRELSPETSYAVSVYPLDFFGNKGTPITCTVTTAAAPEEEEDILLEPEAYYRNLVPYGNAESAVSTDWGKFKNATFSQEKTHGGLYAVKLHNTGSQAQVQVNLRGVVPKNDYRISLWVYVPTGEIRPTVQHGLVAAIETPWKTLDSQYGTVPATVGGWSQYSFTYTAPAKTNLLQISFYTDTVDSYFYLDDLEIVRLCSHTYTTHVPADGELPEHWACRRCGKLFADADCAEELVVGEPDDGSVKIDFDTATDVVTDVGYSTSNARSYFVFQTEKPLPVTDWAGYDGSFRVMIDGESLVAGAAGMNNAHQFQIYVPGDHRAATAVTIPAGTEFYKNGRTVRFEKDFTIAKKNGAWIKDVPPVVPTDHGGDTALPADALSAGVSNGHFNATTGQNFNGDAHIENGLGVLPASGTNDYIQFNGVTVTAGVEYTLAFYVWVTEASNGFEFDLFFFGAGSPTGTWLDYTLGSDFVTSSLQDGIRSATSGWQRVTITWTAPASGDAVFGMKNYGEMASGMVYVDDVSVTYTPPTVRETTLDGYNVTLASDIRIGVLVTPADGTSLSDLTLVYTVGEGDEQTAALSDGLFYCDVAAKDMTATVVVRVLDRTGTELAAASTSLRGYAVELLTGNFSATVKKAARAMLGYGAAAQVYFDSNTEFSADAGYEYSQAELDAANPGDQSGVNISGDTPTGYVGATLLLRSKVGIRLYFEQDVTGSLVYSEANNLYYYEIPEIGAAALGAVQSVTLGDTTYEASVLSLAKTVMESAGYDPAFKTLMQTLVLYHAAAMEL